MNALVGHLDSVICGDNATVMATWPDGCVDLVVTSPPYDNAREYGQDVLPLVGGGSDVMEGAAPANDDNRPSQVRRRAIGAKEEGR